MSSSLLASPLFLAVIVTVANTLKPITVDDTAYLAFARQIASHPTDPYGFTIFWWSKPEPAMHILCPPVVPYWLAVGVWLFGAVPVVLKLWTFPFVFLFAWAVRMLILRFARGTEAFALPLLVLSPAVLPAVNLMLDVPALALALTSLELFARLFSARPTNAHWAGAVGVGLVAALAMQTKYSAFAAPAVIFWYGLTHSRVGLAAVAVAVAVGAFAGWELLLDQKYGESHFLFHATAAAAPPEGKSRLAAFVDDKFGLIGPLVSHLGCLAVGCGLLAASALRLPRRWLLSAAVVWCCGFVLVAVLPRRWTALGPDLYASEVFWNSSGWWWLAAVTGCSFVLLVRVKKGLAPRLNVDALFLVGWLVLELAAALALTPFPAARRVIGVTVVMGLVAARAAGRIARADPARQPPRWVLVIGVVVGFAVAGVDLLDAFPEKECAELAAGVTLDRPESSTVWYAGHWGFQYYCERNGMRPIVPGETLVRAGDFVVLPVYPDDGFHRPYAGFAVVEPVWAADEVAVFEWDDPLSAKTVPNYYGGVEPVTGRDHPRLRVRVYRMRSNWLP
jgi:hypothetical protein